VSQYYKKILIKIYLVSTLFFTSLLYIIYLTLQNYAIEENAAKVQDLLMHNKALHIYVEQTLKPIIYDFQKKDILPKSYFNPEILSFTYISRHIMQEYNNQREKNNLQKLTYKISSTNPRNSINLANRAEQQLLERFKKGEITKYTQNITQNSHKYIYYAMPITKNKESCMRCHSTPERAPADMIKTYGETKGFHEKIGDIRAFISIRMPLDVEMHKMRHIFFLFVVVIVLIYLTTIPMLYLFIRKLDRQDQKLQNQIKIDGLTKIFNRYKFNIDTKKFLQSQRDETIYLTMFDIDHFKKINDTYGHPVGDIILEELCSIVTKAIRSTDRFYRIGGEEFAIISFSNNEKAQYAFTQKIHQIVAKHHFSHVDHVTISIGYTQFIKDESFKDFYERCDKALYEAKNSGRNCVKSL